MTDAERALLLAKENRELKLKLAQKEEELKVAADKTPTIEIDYVIYLRNKVDELKQAYLEALKTAKEYQWEIAEKHGIIINGEYYRVPDWERVATPLEQKQATIFDNEMRKAWRAYQEALREEERIVRK